MKLSRRGAITMITAGIAIVLGFGTLAINLVSTSSKLEEQTAQMLLLKEEYNSIYSELNSEKEERMKYQRLYDEVSVRNEQLEAELENWRNLGQFTITYYWPGEDRYGALTSTGIQATEGVTVAVDPAIIPYGSKIKINGKVYIAQDCGGVIKGNKIDVFVESPKMQKYTTEIYIEKHGFKRFKERARKNARRMWLKWRGNWFIKW